jgi:hypothetical protein
VNNSTPLVSKVIKYTNKQRKIMKKFKPSTIKAPPNHNPLNSTNAIVINTPEENIKNELSRQLAIEKTVKTIKTFIN